MQWTKHVPITKKYAETDFKLADILVRLNRKNGHYVSGAENAVGYPTRTGDTSFRVETPMVDKALVNDVLEYGEIPSQIIRFVEEGKKEGFLK